MKALLFTIILFSFISCTVVPKGFKLNKGNKYMTHLASGIQFPERIGTFTRIDPVNLNLNADSAIIRYATGLISSSNIYIYLKPYNSTEFNMEKNSLKSKILNMDQNAKIVKEENIDLVLSDEKVAAYRVSSYLSNPDIVAAGQIYQDFFIFQSRNYTVMIRINLKDNIASVLQQHLNFIFHEIRW